MDRMSSPRSDAFASSPACGPPWGCASVARAGCASVATTSSRGPIICAGGTVVSVAASAARAAGVVASACGAASIASLAASAIVACASTIAGATSRPSVRPSIAIAGAGGFSFGTNSLGCSNSTGASSW